jgi:tRNA 2-thiocytidine biosynthesis protein TtcA
MFRALQNVRPSHLADPAIFDFLNLAPGTAQPGQDEGLPPSLR